MTLLDRVLPTPRLVEVNHVDVAAPPPAAWVAIRHDDLARRSALVRALFAIRTRTGAEETHLRIDDLRSSTSQPGFQVLLEEPGTEVVVGAIGKVWQLDIPFLHVDDAEAFARFDEPGFVKVAWAIRALDRGDRDARIEIEIRVDATDDDAWTRFKRYFAVVGLGSRLIRHVLLGSLARELGDPEAREHDRSLPGDELLDDATAMRTDGITIAARADDVWPWLLQLGGDRAGFYSVDLLDNGNRRSAREVHRDWQALRVGDVVPATPDGPEGFEVLRLDPGRALVLGGLWDPVAERQLPFGAPRPDRFWHVTWAFVLEPLDASTTRLHVRVRGAYPASGRFHAAWIRPVHGFMEHAQLAALKARAEGKLPRDDARDVLDGVRGAAWMLLGLMTPFLRRARSHWGVDEATAARALPGDDLIPSPQWSWTHGVAIDAEAAEVWPWIAQIGAERGGFYSYQWLENVAGCNLHNAETVHPEWEMKPGDALRLHPRAPALRVAAVERGRWLVAFGAPDEAARAAGRPWATASWLFYVEPIAPGRCRLVSRYRAAGSADLATRVSFGPALLEPIGFAMDRRMLLGVKERAERRAAPRAHLEAPR